MRILTKIIAVSACVLLLEVTASTQAPLETTAAEFRSIPGRFGIKLTEKYSDYKPAVPLQISGKSFYFSIYKWNLPSADFSIGHASGGVDFEARGQTSLLLAGMRGQFIAHLENGTTIISERRVDLDGHPGVELVLQSSTNKTTAQFFAVRDRLYLLTMSLNAGQVGRPQRAIDAFNSFRLLPEQILSEERARFTDKLVPDPLPQEPFVSRPTTDVQDKGLKGSVKRVTSDVEFFVGNDLSGVRGIAAEMEFNEKGYLTREMDYDRAGLTHMVMVYGYKKGQRVARMATRRLGLLEPSKKPSSNDYISPTSDRDVSSFQFEYEYTKDGQLRKKRIFIDATAYNYEGETRDLKNKRVNHYGGNLLDALEEGIYPIIYLLDNNGIPVERRSALQKSGSPFERSEIVEGAITYNYSYEFDMQGNWIKRTSTETKEVNGKWVTAPFNVIYRTIAYF